MLNARLPLLAATALALSAMAAPVAHARKKAHVTQAADCGAINSIPGEVSLAATRDATLCLINIERQQGGRPSLRLHPTLTKVATRYSIQMADDNFFAHVSPGGSSLTSRVKKTSYIKGARSWMLGENLGWGTGRLSTPRDTVDAWMHSPGHRSNILNAKFRDIGIGVTVGTPTNSENGGTYTTDFGRRD
jgi:uncharacterized protein YkwD